MEASEDVILRLVEQHSQQINVMDKLTLYKLPAYEKALGVSSATIAEVVESQIVYTGKAQTTILDDVAKFAQGLHKSTGIPLKSISANTLQIMPTPKGMVMYLLKKQQELVHHSASSA